MSMTHFCIAHLFTSRLSMAETQETESSAERGQRALEEAWSLKRLGAALYHRLRGETVRDPAAELDAAVLRLAQLSPHLLVDVGLDPETGVALGQGEDSRVWRPVRAAAPEPMVAPDTPSPVRKPTRLRLHVRVLPDLAETAEPLRT